MNCTELKKISSNSIYLCCPDSSTVHSFNKNTLLLFYYHYSYITIAWQCFYWHLLIISKMISLSFAYMHVIHLTTIILLPPSLVPSHSCWSRPLSYDPGTSISFVCDSESFINVAYRDMGKGLFTETQPPSVAVYYDWLYRILFLS